MSSSDYAQAAGRPTARALTGLVAFVVLIGAGCGSDTETHSAQRKPPSSAVVGAPSTTSATKASATVSTIRPAQSQTTEQITVAQTYVGPGRARSQVSGGVAARKCVGYVGVVVLPLVGVGKTSVTVTVRGLTGAARAFRYAKVLGIDNAGDPAIGADKLGRVRGGRYLFVARFLGDAKRFPRSYRRTTIVPTRC
jgi:hypothetical protein